MIALAAATLAASALAYIVRHRRTQPIAPRAVVRSNREHRADRRAYR